MIIRASHIIGHYDTVNITYIPPAQHIDLIGISDKYYGCFFSFRFNRMNSRKILSSTINVVVVILEYLTTIC